MRKTFMPLLLLLIGGESLAFQYPIEITEYIDDIKVYAYVNKSQIDQAPQWVPFAGPPPLSIGAALQAVRDHIELRFDARGIRMTGIELKAVPHHSEYWHYLVKVQFERDGHRKSHYFVVLMNGKVIPAIKRPEPIK